MKSIIGLSIGPDVIRLAQVEKTAEGLQLKKARSIAMPLGAMKDGVIIQPKAVADAINELFKSANVKTQKVAVDLRTPHAFLRLIRLPQMSKQEMKVALQGEVTQYAAFTDKETVIDFYPIEEITEENSKKASVLLAIAPKEICTSYLKAIELAGLDLDAIDVSPVATMRALATSNLDIPGVDTAMLVTVNLDSVEICVLKGKSLRFFHTAEADLSSVIADIDDFLEKLTTAIKLSLNFYQVRFAQREPISKIVVSANLPWCKDLGERLSAKMPGIPLEIAQPTAKIQLDPEEFDTSKKEDVSLAFTTAIGLALRQKGFSDYPINLNLVPPEKSQKQTLIRQISYLVIGAVGLGLIFLSFGAFLNYKIKSAKARLAQIDAQSSKPDPTSEKKAFVRRKNDGLRSRLARSKACIASAGSTAWYGALVEVMALPPEDIQLSGISVSTGKDVQIKGESTSDAAIFDYVNSLKRCRYLNSVKLASGGGYANVAQEKMDFVINCKLEPIRR